MLPYELVAEMLHKSYRDQTLSYFAKHNIKWWSSKYDVGRPQRPLARSACRRAISTRHRSQLSTTWSLREPIGALR